jgi:hypothetical protein
MYEEIISKLGPIFEKNISSSLAEIDFEREVGRLVTCDAIRSFCCPCVLSLMLLKCIGRCNASLVLLRHRRSTACSRSS